MANRSLRYWMLQFFNDYRKYFICLGCLLVVQIFLVIRVVNLNSGSSNLPRYVGDEEYKERIGDSPRSGSRKILQEKADIIPRLNVSLSFTPECEINIKEAISAITRAKTEECKKNLVSVTCDIARNVLYPQKLPRFCKNNVTTYGRHLGCYKDEPQNRILPDYFISLKEKNSPLKCIDLCLQYGYQYAGVQYAVECFCGNAKPSDNSALLASECDMKCPYQDEPCDHEVTDNGMVSPFGAENRKCGGYFSMDVYETGIFREYELKNEVIHFSEAVKHPEIMKNPVRVVFLLTLNGRALRQVIRLVKSLFHKQHYFYIHIDARQDYLYRELLVLSQTLPENVKFMKNRRPTIWGGASLLDMLLAAMKDLVENADTWNWQWDYVINLSESDFPLKSTKNLVGFLTLNRGKNFIKSHGREVHKFIQKQGLDKSFYECEYRMWRVGDRLLPKGILWDGGSDWVALHRKFVEYVTYSQDDLVTGLKIVFKYALLPAESFFHTVLRNSAMCNTFVDNNLHVTNWKRKLGCKCQYRNVVDWCGCSPNDFRMSDWPRLQLTKNRLMFFGRKFEPIVNQAVINELEHWLDDSRYHSHKHTDDRYWQSVYHHDDLSPKSDDTVLTLAYSLGRLSGRKVFQGYNSVMDKTPLPTNLNNSGSIDEKKDNIKIVEITAYSHNDEIRGLLVHFDYTRQAVRLSLESYFKFRVHISKDSNSIYSETLLKMSVGVDYDQKEQIFRQYHRAIGTYSEPTLVCNFALDEPIEVTVSWVNVLDIVESTSNVNVSQGSTTIFVKPALKQPLMIGKWTVNVKIGSDLPFASVEFLVMPAFPGGIFTPTADETRPSTASFSKEDSFTADEASNSSQDLTNWLDINIEEFYEFQAVCLTQLPNLDVRLDSIPLCSHTTWSSMYPDPKSTILGIDKLTGLLVP